MSIYKVKCYKCKKKFPFDTDDREPGAVIMGLRGPDTETVKCICQKCGTLNIIDIDAGEQSSTVKDTNGRMAEDGESEWLKQGQKLIEEAPQHINNTAKELIALSSSLIAVYTAALTFFKVPDKILGVDSSLWTILAIIALVIPIGIWLYSIKQTVKVYDFRKMTVFFDSPASIKKALQDIADDKFIWYTEGRRWFLIALGMASIVILIGAAYQPADDRSVRFMVQDNNTPILENMSIQVNAMTGMTDAYKLITETDTTIEIELDQNSSIKFNKNLVTGTFYLENGSF